MESQGRGGRPSRELRAILLGELTAPGRLNWRGGEGEEARGDSTVHMSAWHLARSQ